MKKKYLVLLIFLLFVFGCNKKENNVENKENIENIEVEPEPVPEPIEEPQVPEYQDLNNTPISLYYNKKRVSEIEVNIQVGKDIARFQAFPSTDEYLSYNGSFGQAFHDKFFEYNQNNNLKIGYNLSYDVIDGRHFSQTIKHIPQAYDLQGYILPFLYDDYDLLINNKIYKHVDIEEETDSNIFSTIKLYGEAASGEITSKITLTVFTYDTEDDFDENGEYRGNSKYSMTICQTGKTC